ncbi:outer membrane beta-barrel protein [Pontibacter sp. G13]|uniref:outer membrane beta-barrel protein n=1 Tax=Pontibacter sp. G13 TaxID=3074898 RepID=UPI002889D4C5|nr:outer membrane beta-barrel protein [Pontibacter sp. G13]WNJ15965.1 outer membrane beta-barrel protein [Pontibacter sp. G13]
MPNDTFDNIIKRKLEGYSLPFSEGAWEAYIHASDLAIDRHIAESLHQLESNPDFSTSDWSQFSEALTEQSDGSLRVKLDSHEIPSNEFDWAHMAAKLDGAAFEEVMIDKLEHAAPLFVASDWEDFSAKLDEDPVDTAIRDKLVAASLPLAPQAWETFEAHQAATFDHVIQQKVAQLEVGIPAGDWEMMASMLDPHPFDGWIRTKLAHFAVPYDPAHWAYMQEKLDAPIEEIVRTKLSNGSYLFSQPEWKTMAGMLAQAGMLGRPAWWEATRKYGSIAAVILLLILFGTWQNQRSHGDWIPWNGLAQSDSELTKETDDVGTLDTLSVMAQTQEITEGERTNTALSDTSPEGLHEGSFAELQPIASPSDPDLLAQEIKEEEAPSVGVDGEPIVFPSAATTDPKDQWTKIDRLFMGHAFSLSSPSIKQNGVTIPEEIVDKKGPKIKFGIYVASTNTKAELTRKDTQKGFNAGGRVEIRLNDRWSTLMGLQYSEKLFKHEYYLTSGNQSFAFALDGDMQFIEFPLLMRYTFPSTGKLSLYLQGGMVTMVSIREDYTHYSPLDGGQNGPSVDPRRQPSEDRTWNLNTYPGNVQVSMGLEYQLTKGISLQLEPYFQQSLQRTKGADAVGLNKRLYSGGIGFSIMYNLAPLSKE